MDSEPPSGNHHDASRSLQGYPGGIFDPMGMAKGNAKDVQTKEIKNGRLAMIAFAGRCMLMVCDLCEAVGR